METAVVVAVIIAVNGIQGFWIKTALDSASSGFNARIDDLRADINARFAEINTRLGKVDDRLRALEHEHRPTP